MITHSDSHHTQMTVERSYDNTQTIVTHRRKFEATDDTPAVATKKSVH